MRLQPLPVLERRALQRTYGERGIEMLGLLHNNPIVAVPVIVARLEQKVRVRACERVRVRRLTLTACRLSSGVARSASGRACGAT
jgi:hypothetical protein